MLIEAEVKARLRNVDEVCAALESYTLGQRSGYFDRYFDFPDGRWTTDGHELRVRTVTGPTGSTAVLLTYKKPAVDATSGSKPEYETVVGDAEVLVTIITALGVEQTIAFEKRCTNYRFVAHGRELVASVVTVPELDGETFIELETLAVPGELSAALGTVRNVLVELGVNADDFTTEQYTDAVAARR